VHLTIGVTGHRDLLAAEVPALRKKVRDFFKQLESDFPGLEPQLITPLAEGSDRLLDRGVASNITSLLVNAEHLPFQDASMNCVTIGFGLRNVTDKQAALNEMARVIRPGGRVMVLEFSKPVLKWLEPVYDAYSFKILPALGKLVANDAESYRYLAESIRMHPDQETLKGMMETAGLEDCRYHNLSGGIVALHIGYRY